MASLVLSFLHRAKFRRKIGPFLHLFPVIVALVTVYLCMQGVVGSSSSSSCDDVQCLHGTCQEGRCICDRGWQGSACQSCGGRVKLTEPTGFITDGVGNYTVDMQCTWLIDSNQNNATIRLLLTHFETECTWDHLYVFDGDSVFAPLVAAYSGSLVKGEQHPFSIPEIVTYSGRAYLYFYSDAAYNMTGFNISYSVNSCPKNCSGNGPCADGTCTCSWGWKGEACDIPICPENCTFGTCEREEHKCICESGYTGVDCSVKEHEGFWTVEESLGQIQGRALHQVVVHEGYMWVIGGESFQRDPSQFMTRYHFSTKKWEVWNVSSSIVPLPRFGHSVVLNKNKFYMYGGMLPNGTVTNELWMFDIYNNSWSLISDPKIDHQCLTDFCSPLASMGHTATVVKDKMIVIFGHSPGYGYLNTVQEFDFVSRKWYLVTTKGALVKGGFGHTSVYDPEKDQIFVHGGYHSRVSTESVLVDFLYRYHPIKQSWSLLTPSHSRRYLHSAVIIHGLMLVFGGNSHNSTSDSSGENCFSPDFLAYEIACDTWHVMNATASYVSDLGRFGHTAVLYNGSMYIFGGFNGRMLSSILKYTPGTCKSYATKDSCAVATPGSKCMWNIDQKTCQPLTPFSLSSSVYYSCPQKSVNFTSLCEHLTSCPSCLENTYDCVWCGTTCSPKKCRKGAKVVSDINTCEDATSSNCDKLHNCHACHTEYHCGWQADNKCYTFIRELGNRTEKAVLTDDYRAKCEAPCSSRTTCENCTQGQCMWCSSQKRCIESNAYAAVFPVAQCLEWTIDPKKCPDVSCTDIQTCEKCHQNPRCGWCDDGSGTGVGVCLEGSASGPMVWNGSSYQLNQNACPKGRWYFTSCPECQCNGHSVCLSGSDDCQKPCKDLTEGSHCQFCMAGYYGNPVNGGNCTTCFCNNHGTLCHSESGKCYCTTKGIIGHHCDRCDEPNHYFGNPQDEGGSCFYNLTIDFQYTFNMSKAEDKYYTQINFMNVPVKPDVDVDFTIVCSELAFVNISIGSGKNTLPLRLLHERHECGSFKLRFSHVEHLFGVENTTFFVYVYGFQTPFLLQISFSQHRTLDLLQFFITFSSCFLSLLIIAAILWKIKQKYDLYRRRQQLFVEMEQMASRPFAGVIVEVERHFPDQLSSGGCTDGKRPNLPTPIALEPCAGGKAAVLSLIVCMPTGGGEYTPAGQSGLSIASALVSLGTLGKTSVDGIKEEAKTISWKSSTHSGNCL